MELSWQETRSGGTWGSHLGQIRGPDQSPVGSVLNQEGGNPEWSTDQGGPRINTLEWIFFPDLAPRAKPYCGVKCSQGLHFPVGICYKARVETCIIDVQTVKTYL